MHPTPHRKGKPMGITAADIHNQSFSIDRKGYDVDEVDVFLEHVADEIDILNEQIEALHAQLDAANEGAMVQTPPAASGAIVAAPGVDVSEYQDIIAEKDDIIADLEHQLEEKKANDSAISQALIIAQRSADDIVAKANAEAAETVQDARDEATRILNRANADKQAVIDAIRKLEDDREDAREEYSDILKDFIADASRKLADLGAFAVPVAAASDYEDHQAEIVEGVTSEFEIDDVDAAPVDYTTPQTGPVTVAAATPVASAYEKDLSGFGDTDDFEYDEVD